MSDPRAATPNVLMCRGNVLLRDLPDLEQRISEGLKITFRVKVLLYPQVDDLENVQLDSQVTLIRLQA